MTFASPTAPTVARTEAERVELVASALGVSPAGSTASALLASLGEPDPRTAYLVLAVFGGSIPEPDSVVRAVRSWRLDGSHSLLAGVRRSRRPVRLASGITVDVDETARQPFMTGIQRVVRNVLPLWDAETPLDPVVWGPRQEALRPPTGAERSLALGSARPGTKPSTKPARAQSSLETVVPFGGVFVLPEISVSRARDARLRTIAEFSGARCVAIGYDCVPITSAETAAPGMPGAFASYLSALSRFHTVAAISTAAAAEFSGWAASLAGAGEAGPRVVTVGLPTAAADPGDPDSARGQLALQGQTVVLSVGSHEPRKNHLALLHAAELAWRAGAEFTLVMVGGRSWEAAEFERTVTGLRAAGRSIVTISGASDSLVDGLYRAARFTAFPSLNEGFGLPVAESIAHGTPVLTSDIGSMRELGDGHGGLLVDPRDDAAIAAAFLRMLRDDALIARLRAETATLPRRTWSDYARDLREALLA